MPSKLKGNVHKSDLFGGTGGFAFDDSHEPAIVGIREIWIRHGNQVDAIRALYTLADGSTHLGGQHGGPGGTLSHIVFAEGEMITEVKGMTNDQLVDQLTFITNRSTYGPYGRTGRTSFSLQKNIIAFHGRCGDLLDGIGFYYYNA